jgi:hypothetical protein
MKKILLIIIAAVVAYGLFLHEGGILSSFVSDEVSKKDRVLQEAYKKQESGLQVNGKGVVIKKLSDDVDGSRHQRFILKLASGQTLLIAHNIDLAPRIDELMLGDNVEFYGEYEWNSKGGVIHWTHHDPSNKHVVGWLKHGGRKYQ